MKLVNSVHFESVYMCHKSLPKYGIGIHNHFLWSWISHKVTRPLQTTHTNVWGYREDEIVRPTPQQWSTKQNHFSHTHLDLGSQPSLSRSQQIIFCWTKSFTQQWVQEVTNRLRFDLRQTEEMKKQQFLLTIAFHYQSVHKDKVIWVTINFVRLSAGGQYRTASHTFYQC